jgi:hypothetical protein
MMMLLCVLMIVPLVAICAAVDPKEPAPTPLMRTVDPYMVKVGGEVTVAGDNLQKERIAEVYLTIDKTNTKVQVTAQSEKELKFIVPNVKPGSYRVTVLVRSVDPTLIEEPVRVVVQE